MDLSGLGTSLPPGLADAERDMGDKFRAAALSITNLYKSSLSYTKQSYNVGYSAALADVLSTVQSSIGAGQNAEQALSRLMDWAEARQAAISAFAAEDRDTDDTPAPPQQPAKRPTTLARSGLSHLSAPIRPASAPIPSHPHINELPAPNFERSKNEQAVVEDGAPAPVPSSSRISPVPMPTPAPAISSSSNSTTPNTSIDSAGNILVGGPYQPTPAGIMSSSPMGSPSNRPIFTPAPVKPSKNLPMRYSQTLRGSNSSNGESSSASSSSMPTSTFNPSIPLAGVPFVSFTTNVDGPAQNYPTGAKRPMMDGMEIDSVSLPNNTTPTTVSVQTPSSNRSGRASKRRSLGSNIGGNGSSGKNDDGDGAADGGGGGGGNGGSSAAGKDRERRKGSKKHGHGAGTGAV
ncbi:hypothetical protein I316_00616 [Kwoniella heveanensis BCC8398]|uniref:Uncharacterized protein n=1 Tax=Kwoniella heveanensis BCC8398 TaxID=1296120 RepID=A0A1B9H2J7_9TREE|nr:hypothetical protein I316_00616 [Kwoniella heveanensis BCC8398]